MGSFKLHEEMKQMLIQDPTKLGLEQEEIEEIKEEVPILGEKDALIAQPDIVIKKKDGIKVFVEIKSGCHWRAKERLKKQMRKLQKYTQRMKIQAEILGIHLTRAGSLVMITM